VTTAAAARRTEHLAEYDGKLIASGLHRIVEDVKPASASAGG
jgi:hypothetical protein